MVDGSQFVNSYSASFSVFLIMSIVSLGFSIIFYLESRSVKKIPRNLTVSVFNKTFNVIDLSYGGRKVFHSYLFFLILSPLIAFLWTFVLVFVVFLQILEAGLILGLVIFLLCLALMMLTEATEVYADAATLRKAAKKQASFGRGDILILSIVKKILGKLSVYYLLLSITFGALFFAMPPMLPTLIFAFSQFVGLMVGATIGIPLVSPFAAAFLFSLSMVAVFVASRKAKSALFGFKPSGLLLSPVSASARTKITYEMLGHLFEENPDELTW